MSLPDPSFRLALAMLPLTRRLFTPETDPREAEDELRAADGSTSEFYWWRAASWFLLMVLVGAFATLLLILLQAIGLDWALIVPDTLIMGIIPCVGMVVLYGVRAQANMWGVNAPWVSHPSVDMSMLVLILTLIALA